MKRCFHSAICCTEAARGSGTSAGSSLAHTACIVYSTRIGCRSRSDISLRHCTASGRWSEARRRLQLGTRMSTAHACSTTPAERAKARSTSKSTPV